MADNLPGRLRVALVGQGISRSLTPALHAAEGRAAGLRYSYSLMDTATDAYRDRSLADIVATARADGFVGLNITHPYKVEIVALLDSLSDDGRKLGAVNTVVFSNDRSMGHNTDFTGFTASFRTRFGDAPRQRVLLLGAGGAGAAVAAALLVCGVRHLLIHDVVADRAPELAARLRRHFPGARTDAMAVLDRRATRAVDGVVNATPMGMASHAGAALPANFLRRDMWVADIVYFPLQTQLLADAGALGCRVMSGAGMAIFQAAQAFELFTGRPANPDRMAGIFARMCGEREHMQAKMNSEVTRWC
jgi:quinate/shikimate dehydrogenase (NAD+)